MYAVIETGGKQYRVEVGTELEVELLDAAPGDALTFDRVLLVADAETAAIGRPVVPNASVAARVIGRDRGDKVISFKYRPKARRRVKKGHRQELTLLRINDIVLDGHSAAADVREATEARERDRARLEEAARRQAAADAELAARLAAEKPVAAKAAPKSAKTVAAGRSGTDAKTAGAKTAGAKAKGAKGTRAKATGTEEPAPKGAAKTTRGTGASKASASSAAAEDAPTGTKSSAKETAKETAKESSAKGRTRRSTRKES